MKSVVYKYKLNSPLAIFTELLLPADYRILSVGYQHGGPDAYNFCFWASHTHEALSLPEVKVRIELYGTDWPIEDLAELRHLGTFHVDPHSDYPEVYHAFQRIAVRKNSLTTTS